MGMRESVRRRAGLLLLLGSLAGCAGYEWRKEGATQEQARRDEELCERHAESFRRPAPPGGLFVPPGMGGYYDPRPGEEAGLTQRFLSCMEARGYRRVRTR
jgi:hypothetical protein